MSVRVQLDRPNGEIYTNLDFVKGRVYLTLPTDATISAITVKLEGESKTRLDGPKSVHDQDRRRVLLELHKLLYKVETVFPSPEIREASGASNKSAQYTLSRGQYEYPFQFKIPFNNDCINNTSLMKDLKVGQLRVEFGQEPSHGKFPLPPTLGGYPGEAEIKYFVKATVVRPKFYQENLRNEVPITFLPIEQPRPEAQGQEIFGRRQHQFQRTDSGKPGTVKSLFSSKNQATSDNEPLMFKVDVRLPNPAIITCRQPLPLRILIEKLNESSSSLYLSILQLELIGTTYIRAHDLQREEKGTWLLFSQANMSVPLGHPSGKTNQWEVPSHFWDRIPLPTTVSPTFKTCNVSRTYELEVRVGLSHGLADGVKPEIIVSPIRLEVQVFSGIKPPQELLNRQDQDPLRKDSILKLKVDTDSSGPPITPVSRPAYTHSSPISHTSANDINVDDLPPSYEDAMASDLAPVDGPRPQGYRADGSNLQGPAFNADSKGGLGRRVSERLFATNAPARSRSGRQASADLSRYGGDIVEESDQLDMDGHVHQTASRSSGNCQESERRPPLPARKASHP